MKVARVNRDGPQVVDAHRGLRRDLHAAARHHGRERRAAGHPARPGRQLHRAAVGRRRLRPDARDAACSRPGRSPTCSGAGSCSRRGSCCSPSLRCCAAWRPARSPSTSSAALQGIGGAVMFATALALIAQEFHGPRARARRSGSGGRRSAARWRSGRWWAACSPRRSGWEWIFFVNVPIGIAAVVLTLVQACGSRATPDARGIDWAGSSRSRAGRCSCSSSRSSAANEEGWGSTLIVVLPRRLRRAAASCSSAIELRQERPMLDLSAVPQADASPARRSWPSRCRPRCSRCSSTSRSISRTCSASRRWRPGVRFLPMTVVSFVVAPIAGRAVRAGAGARLARRRPTAGRRRAAADGRR